MRSRNLVLSITLGVVIVIGLVLALNSQATAEQVQFAQVSAVTTIDHSDTISRALAYLRTRQLPDGGIEGWTAGVADDFTTVKTVIALAAARYPVSLLTSVSDTTPLEYLAAQAITYTHDEADRLFPGRAGMLAVAIVAADRDPRDFGGMDIVDALAGAYHPATGAYSTTASQGFASGAAGAPNQLWAILGLAAAQEPIPVSATDFLVGLQEPDGGWGWGTGTGDVDTTAMVIQALLASGNMGPTHIDVQEGLAFLQDTQAESGGWESWGSLSADSTAAVIQAVVAAGYTPATESWARSSDPHTVLAGLQAADGSFGGNPLGTAHAIAGLAEAPLPILGRVQRANRALAWMHAQQSPDGSWSTSFGHPAGPTCEAVLAYAAAGFDPHTVKAAGNSTSAMDYLSSTASSYAYEGAKSAGKLAVAVEAAGEDAHAFGGIDLVHVLTATWYSPTLGAFGDPDDSWDQAFAMLGLAAAGEPIPASAIQTLKDLQNADDGSWVDAWGFSKPDSTGLALQALIAAGVPATDTNVVSGTQFLLSEQNDQGGWSFFGSPSANTTAYAMQGLLAAGEDLVASKWLKDGHSPYSALANLQKIDGPFTLGSQDDIFATRQAVPALLGRSMPLHHAGLVMPYAPVYCGPDPDRMVVLPPKSAPGNSIVVTIPFGSDLNADGAVTLEWRGAGVAEWTMATLYRAAGFYTATLPVSPSADYELRTVFADPDLVQYGSTLTDKLALPMLTYLPLIFR